MTTPRVLVLRSPGANCDEETADAFRLAGAVAERVHVNRLLELPGLLDEYQILCLPGGFSYGDDVAAGRVLGNRLRLHLADPLREFRDQDKLILGICNGFQVLAKTGLLDLEDSDGPLATLTWNDHGRYEARWVHLAATSIPSGQGKCVFLQDCEQLELPIAHAEGNIQMRDAKTFQQLVESGQVVLRYATADSQSGEAALPFPINPNGSAGNAAGLCDSTGRVFGLMPHPERFVSASQHPRWTRASESSLKVDGLQIFENGVNYFA